MLLVSGKGLFSPLMLISVLVISLNSSWCSWPLAVVAESTTVKHLPGFHGPLPFELETGYVSVDELNDAQLFYYFIKSERNPREDPLMVWLTGGPGCSGFSGLVFEIGPLRFDVAGYNGGLPTLVYDPLSWTKECSIIFLDSPIGTGFSYSRGMKGYQVGDSKSAREIYSFIKKWFNDHQEYLSNPLYIGGDSYSGKTLPIVTQEISNGIQAGNEPLFNLKGYLIGNPITDHKFDEGFLIPFLHGMGIISDELYELTKQSCGGEYTSPSNPQCVKYIASAHQCMSGINFAHILEPSCSAATPKPNGATDRRSIEERTEKLYLSKSLLPLDCRSSGYLLSKFWANDITVREAIGIRKGTISHWTRCNDLSYTKDIPSSINYHINLTTKGYRALIYSGDHDALVPYVGTQAWIRSLNFSIVDDWRSWSVKGQVAGFTRTYSNNLTFATVKGAGHTAPEYRPKECLAMFRRWISGNPL